MSHLEAIVSKKLVLLYGVRDVFMGSVLEVFIDEVLAFTISRISFSFGRNLNWFDVMFRPKVASGDQIFLVVDDMNDVGDGLLCIQHLRQRLPPVEIEAYIHGKAKPHSHIPGVQIKFLDAVGPDSELPKILKAFLANPQS